MSDLLIQFIIFRKQHPFPRKIGDIVRTRFFFGSAVRLRKDIPQFGKEDRLGTECGNTGLSGFLLNIRPVIGSQDNDRCGISDHFPDPAHRFDTVQIRQQPVDNVSMKTVPAFQCIFRPDNSFFPVGGPIRPHPDFPEHRTDGKAGVNVVICDQRPEPLQFRQFFKFRGNITDLARNIDNELAAFSFCAVDFDRSAHHVDNIFRDRHSQTGSLDPADGTGLFPGKCFKNMFLELFSHPDTVILNAEFKIGYACCV